MHACLGPCACSSLCLARPCPRHESDAARPPGSQERGSEPGSGAADPTLAHSLTGHVAPGGGGGLLSEHAADCDGAPPAPQAPAPRSPGPVSVLLSNVRFLRCFSVCSSRLSGLLSAAVSSALRRHQDAQSWPKCLLGVASASVGKAAPL